MWIVEEERVRDFDNYIQLGCYRKSFDSKEEAEFVFKSLLNVYGSSKYIKGECWILRLFKEDDYDNAEVRYFEGK